MKTSTEPMLTWERDGFKFEMWPTDRYDSRSQNYLAYRLTDGDEVIFDDDQFSGSPCHADDSLATLAGCLSFMCLAPGDTESDYFSDYTPRQLEWCQSQRCDELKLWQMELEEYATSGQMRLVLKCGPDGSPNSCFGLYDKFTDECVEFVQTDWDYPGLASRFGFVPCECGATDGTVDCEHKKASDMIAAAYDFLRDHEGEECEYD